MSDIPRSWFRPGTAAYISATTPRNATAEQRPAFVARPTTSTEVADAVREATRRGLRVVPQSTGHGAGGVLGDDVVLLDTARLDDLRIDATSRVAIIGAGLTWGRVNAEAERHGLLAPSGSAPTVGVCGYTFGGGEVESAPSAPCSAVESTTAPPPATATASRSRARPPTSGR